MAYQRLGQTEVIHPCPEQYSKLLNKVKTHERAKPGDSMVKKNCDFHRSSNMRSARICVRHELVFHISN